MKEFAKKITTFESQMSALEHVDLLLRQDGIKNIAFLNAHACLLGRKNSSFADSIHRSDLVLRDGIGVKIMLKYLGLIPGYNANGTDLIPAILKEHKDKRIFCIGTEEPFITHGVEKMRKDDINIVGYMDGFCSNEEMLDEIEKHLPDIVLLGMGMPKQELFCSFLKQSDYKAPILLICGGAIIDFYADRFSRAPSFMRNNGLEWLYRLLSEPRRLFKRYVVGIPVFIFVLLFLDRARSN